MKLQKLCEKVRDSKPGTSKHTAACLDVAEYLNVDIYVGHYVSGQRADEDFALIILRAIEGRDENDDDDDGLYVSPRNKLLNSEGLKVKN